MKKKSHRKHLQLATETVRSLTTADLKHAAGGCDTTSLTTRVKEAPGY